MGRNNDALFSIRAALVLAALAAGCGTVPATREANPSVDANLDPCADRLHDISGRLLLYYSVRRQLPQRLADLSETSRAETLQLTCPVSGKPYVYTPEGLVVSGWPGRLIVHDAQPCHTGLCWGILAEAAKPGQPLVLRVTRLPETAITK